MDQFYVIGLGQRMMFDSLLISLPILGVGLLVGVLISIVQAATQINEQTLTIVPKLFVVGLTIMFLMPWLVDHVVDLTLWYFNQIVEVSK